MVTLSWVQFKQMTLYIKLNIILITLHNVHRYINNNIRKPFYVSGEHLIILEGTIFIVGNILI